MFRIFLIFLLLTQPSWAVTNQWRGGVGTNELDGTQSANLIGFNSYNHIVQPLDNLLYKYCNEYIQYASSTTLTIISGACVVSNSQGTIRLFLQDTANSTLTSANLDTGSITASTTYYVYSTAATNSATTSTYYISTSNTAPSGQTYYYKIGQFSTDSSSQFTQIVNYSQPFGYVSSTPISKSTGVVYQAFTDGNVLGVFNSGGGNNSYATLYSDSTSSPSLVMSRAGTASSGPNFIIGTVYGKIRKGDYYEIVISGVWGSFTNGPYFISTGT